MSLLDSLIPEPDLIQIDSVEVAVPPEKAWPTVRHADFGRSRLVRALFQVRTVPTRLAGHEPEPLKLRIDDIAESGRAGFQVLAEDSGHEVVIGAIGKVWQLDIPFVDIRSKDEFFAFQRPGFVKVAWALRVSQLGDHGSRVDFELRVLSTDADARRAFRRYFMVIGPASHFIRRHLLAML